MSEDSTQRPSESIAACSYARAEPEPSKEPQQQRAPANSRLGPAARLLMHQHGLSPSDISPTGPNGIITKGDVLKAVGSGAQPKQRPKVWDTDALVKASRLPVGMIDSFSMHKRE